MLEERGGFATDQTYNNDNTVNHSSIYYRWVSMHRAVKTRQDKVISLIKKVPSGSKSPLLKHVVSHQRQVYITNNWWGGGDSPPCQDGRLSLPAICLVCSHVVFRLWQGGAWITKVSTPGRRRCSCCQVRSKRWSPVPARGVALRAVAPAVPRRCSDREGGMLVGDIGRGRQARLREQSIKSLPGYCPTPRDRPASQSPKRRKGIQVKGIRKAFLQEF